MIWGVRMKITGIQVWGDSVFRGIQFDERRGRHVINPENPVARAAAAMGMPVENHARMGYTSIDGLQDMLEDESPYFQNQAVLLEYGGNDCNFQWDQVALAPEQAHQCKVPPAQYLETMKSLVHLVKQKGGIPVLTTLPPLNANKFFQWITRQGINQQAVLSFIGDTQQIYRWQEYYSLMNVEIAKETNSIYLPIREYFLAQGPCHTWTCADGMHPNNLGHEWIYQVFLNQWKQATAA